MVAGRDVLEGLLIQTLSVQGHLIGGIIVCPIAAAQTGSTGHKICNLWFFRYDGGILHNSFFFGDREISGAGGAVNVQGSGGDRYQIGINRFYKTVAVRIFGGPAVTAVTDDEADGGGICVCVDSCHHFAVFFSKCVAAGGYTIPGVEIPAVVVTVGAGVVELDGNRTGCLRLFGDLGLFGFGGNIGQVDIDILGFGIESDGDILCRVDGEGVVVAAVAPGIVPGAVGNLEFIGTGRDVFVGFFVQTLIDLSHLVVCIAAIPLTAAQAGLACHIISGLSSKCACRDVTHEHYKRHKQTDQLIHDNPPLV